MSIKGSCDTLWADILSKVLEDCVKQYSEDDAVNINENAVKYSDKYATNQKFEKINSDLESEYEKLCCALRQT